MEVTIQCIKFDATDKLRDYINKKMSKLDKFFDKAISATVYLNRPQFSGLAHLPHERPPAHVD